MDRFGRDGLAMSGWIKPHHVVTARRLCDEAVYARGALMDRFGRDGLAMTGWIKPHHVVTARRLCDEAVYARGALMDCFSRDGLAMTGWIKPRHVVTARRLCDEAVQARGCPDGLLPGTRPGPATALERGCPFREGLCTQQARSDLVLLLRAEARKYVGASQGRSLRPRAAS